MGSLRRAYGLTCTYGFEWVHAGVPRGRQLHWDSRGLTRAGLGVFEFIRVRVCLHAGAPRGRRVRSGLHEFPRAYLLVVHGFTWEHLRIIVFIRVRLYSHRRVNGLPCTYGFAWVHAGVPRGCRLHWGWRGVTRAGLGVFEFIRVRVGSHGRAYGSSVSLWIT